LYQLFILSNPIRDKFLTGLDVSYLTGYILKSGKIYHQLLKLIML